MPVLQTKGPEAPLRRKSPSATLRSVMNDGGAVHVSPFAWWNRCPIEAAGRRVGFTISHLNCCWDLAELLVGARP
jgi:hypothetical protein